MNKCIASQDGICRNVFGFGTQCDGYSDRCGLKPHYDARERMANAVAEQIRNCLGIKGDGE